MRQITRFSVLIALCVVSAVMWAPPRRVEAAVLRPVPASAAKSPAAAVAVVRTAKPTPAAPRVVAQAERSAPSRTTAVPVRPFPVATAARTPEPVPARPTTPTTHPAPVPQAAPTDGCGAALAYLAAHSAPGFTFECPGDAFGHQAMTCINEPGMCPGQKLIAIAVACPASWMNEASNSWVLSGSSSRPIDPYGYCR